MYRIITKRVWHLLLLVVLLGAGCGLQPSAYLPWGEARGPQEDMAEANQLFWDGDYAAAEAIFLRLQEADDPDVTRQALYGLGCTRLMRAGTRQEYLEAVELLVRWREMSSATADGEDPRMLLTLFSGGRLESHGGGAADPENHLLMQLFDSQKQVRTLESRIADLKSQLAASEEQEVAMNEMTASIKEMEKRLSAKEEREKEMAEELVKLKSQLKTLETIDQEIQEKKRGISSP